MNSSPNLRTSISTLVNSHYTLLKGKVLLSEAPKGVDGCTISFGHVHKPVPFSQQPVQWKACDHPGWVSAGHTSRCRRAKGHSKYLYMLPSITLRGEMGTGISWRAEKYQAAVNINLFHCCRVCASVLKQKRIRLATGSPSAFGKWCWGRALLSARLD